MKNKVLVIGRTDTIGGFGIQLFDKNPTCDCCFSKLNLEKSKVKKLIDLLVTYDEECKDVVITEVIINNSFIGKELNFGENNNYTFKKKHLLVTEPINVISTIANAKDEETAEPMSKENLEKMLSEDNTDEEDTNIYLVDVNIEMYSLFPLKQKETVRVTSLTVSEFEKMDALKKDLYVFDIQNTSETESKKLFEFCNSFVTSPGINKFYFTKDFINSQIIYTQFYYLRDKIESFKSKFKLVKREISVENKSNDTDGVEPDLYVSPVTLDDKNEYSIIDNNVFKQPFLNILKSMHLTNGNNNDDLIIIKNTIIDIRTIAKLIFKTTDSKSISVIWFGDYYYISINNSYKSLTKQEKSRMNHVLHGYHGLDLYIINK